MEGIEIERGHYSIGHSWPTHHSRQMLSSYYVVGYCRLFIYHHISYTPSGQCICRKVPDLYKDDDGNFIFPFLSPFYRHLHMILPTVSVMNIDKPAGFMDIFFQFYPPFIWLWLKAQAYPSVHIQMFIPQNPDPNLIENPMKIRWKLSWNSFKISIWWPQTSHEISWNLMKPHEIPWNPIKITIFQYFSWVLPQPRSSAAHLWAVPSWPATAPRRSWTLSCWRKACRKASELDVEILGKHLEHMEYPLVI